jgi:hypothetical protein
VTVILHFYFFFESCEFCDLVIMLSGDRSSAPRRPRLRRCGQAGDRQGCATGFSIGVCYSDTRGDNNCALSHIRLTLEGQSMSATTRLAKAFFLWWVAATARVSHEERENPIFGRGSGISRPVRVTAVLSGDPATGYPSSGSAAQVNFCAVPTGRRPPQGPTP